MIIDLFGETRERCCNKSESKTGLQGEANVGLHPQNTTNEIQMVYKQLPLQSVLPGFFQREFVYDFALRHNSHNDAKRFDGDLWGSLWQQIKQKQKNMHKLQCSTIFIGSVVLLFDWVNLAC